jgi:transcriptional regulator of aromatic amino acid metabolism
MMGTLNFAASLSRQPNEGSQQQEMVTDRARGICSIAHTGVVGYSSGGVCSIVIHDVDEMPSVVQNQLLDLLAELELARPPSTAVRLVCGTTVSLLDGIAAGTLSERLFYRLNIIHLISGASRSGTAFA